MALLIAPARAQVGRVEELVFPPLPDFTVPVPERIELANGMVVMLLEDHELPLVDVTARIRTGSRFEPAEKMGLAGLAGT
ncbi:MAG: insulinase family protein, partial [Thermoanaerobaculia bacterium]